MTNPILKQIYNLEDQKQHLIGKARKDAMSTITASLEILSELGHHYNIVKKKRAPRREPPNGKNSSNNTTSKNLKDSLNGK